MATYEIEVLEKADEDMRLLGKYISGELQSPMAAETNYGQDLGRDREARKKSVCLSGLYSLIFFETGIQKSTC